MVIFRSASSVIVGRKRIRLAAPNLWRQAGTYAKHHHQHRNIRRLHVFRKSGSKSSLAENGIFDVEVGPGDALFIPAFWFHEVEALTPASVSLNIWSPAPEVAVLESLWEMVRCMRTLTRS